MSETEAVPRSGVILSFIDHRDSGGSGRVIDPWGNTYNHASNDTNNDLREKFTGLFFGTALGAIFFRIPYRIFDLLTGGSIRRGIMDAKHEYRMLKVEKSKTGQKVHRVALALLLAKNIFLQLVKDIVQIATYPLGLVGLQFASFVGLFMPLEARVVFAKLEDLYVVDFRLFTSCELVPGAMLFYAAPCMQTQESWQRRNIYAIDAMRYNPDTPRSLRLTLSNNLERFSTYFETHFKEIKKSLNHLKAIVSGSFAGESGSKFLQKMQQCSQLFDEVLSEKDSWIDKGAVAGRDSSPKKVIALRDQLKELVQFQF